MKGHLTNPTGAHLSERAFRRFEKHFAQFLLTYPDPYITEPKAIAPITFVTAIREAANAFIHHKFDSYVDIDAFTEAWSKCKVSICADEVHIQLRSIKKVSPVSTQEPTIETNYFTTLTDPTTEQLSTLIQTYLVGIATRPSLLIGRLPEPFDLPSTLVLSPTEDGNHILL